MVSYNQFLIINTEVIKEIMLVSIRRHLQVLFVTKMYWMIKWVAGIYQPSTHDCTFLGFSIVEFPIVVLIIIPCSELYGANSLVR